MTAWRRVPKYLRPEQSDRRQRGGHHGDFRRASAVIACSSGLALACGFGMGGTSSTSRDRRSCCRTSTGCPTGLRRRVRPERLRLVLGTQVNGRLAGRFRLPSALLTCGLRHHGGGRQGLSSSSSLRARRPRRGVVPSLCFLFGSGFLGPNAMALALQRYPGTRQGRRPPSSGPSSSGWEDWPRRWRASAGRRTRTPWSS